MKNTRLNKIRITPFIFLLLMIYSCNTEGIDHSYTFYYWKTTLSLDEMEDEALKESNDPHLYVRLFDVDKKDNQIIPVAKATKNESFKTDKIIVPVVFITNRSFLNIQPEEIIVLVQKINQLVDERMERFNFDSAKEIQIDCDWTAGTKKDYFSFLKLLKEESKKQVTSTLRLHQVKDQESAGIPPVDKVYLMCYSTSSPLENSNKNSILDLDLAKNYLAEIDDYPIKNIAVALPIYSWGIIENHLGKHKIINGLSLEDLDNPKFKKLNAFEAEVLEDGFYFGFFLNKGFKIKIEEVSDVTLKKVIQILEKKLGAFPLVFFQLDSKFI